MKILKGYLPKKNFQTNGRYLYFFTNFLLRKNLLFSFSSSRKDYEFDSTIKIDLEEGSDFEPNENQGWTNDYIFFI